MSYDITFVRRQAGQSLEEAVEAAEEAAEDEDAPNSVDTEVWNRIVTGARDILGEIETDMSEWGAEIEHEQTGIELTYSDSEAGISMPYGADEDDAMRALELAYRLGRVVEAESGLTGYDPQLGQSIGEAMAQPDQQRSILRTAMESLREYLR